MRKYGRTALIGILCIFAMPAAQAEGGFFIGGQGGQIELSDTDFSDDSTDIQALGLGYRWQAGSIVQVGFEVGGGKLGTLKEEFTENYIDAEFSGRATLETTYAYAGANARFKFGAESRWFAIARLGYMGYEEELNYSYEEYYAWDDSYYSYSDSDSESGGGAYFGAGIGVDITSNFNINLVHSGYAYSPSFGDDYDDDDLYTASSTTLGLEVRF
jgi:hypothetical protein